jgi:phage repressor protein C with HTH and peptisase S24 domain
MVKTRDGEVRGWELGQSEIQSLSLKSLNPKLPDQTRKLADVIWVARILWASQ